MSSKSQNIALITKANPFFVSLSGEEKYEWGNKEFARDPSEVDYAGAGGHDSAKVPAQKKGGGSRTRPDRRVREADGCEPQGRRDQRRHTPKSLARAQAG